MVMSRESFAGAGAGGGQSRQGRLGGGVGRGAGPPPAIRPMPPSAARRDPAGAATSLHSRRRLAE
eukprot:3922449-Pleurochrysis_carterae.AAC.1